MTAQEILIVGLNYAPEPVGIGPYTQGVAEALAERGAIVAVVAGQPYYPQWRRYPGYGPGWQTAREGTVRVVRCPHYVPRTPTGVLRMMHLLSFALAALPPALRQSLRARPARPAIVIAVAPTLPGVVAAWLCARLAGAKLWIHVQDFEVEAAFATGLLNQRGALARLAQRFENWVLRRGDRVSTISPQMCARLAAKGVAPQRISELRNWANQAYAPDPAGALALREEWQLTGKMVALYSGNVARKQGIEILVEAARLLANRDDIRVVICGEGPNRAELERLAAGLGNVQLHDLQPAARMGALLAMADIHLLPQIAGAADLVLPSKLTNMLASGRPVVATADPGTGLHAEVDGCGAITPPGEVTALAQAIAALADDPQRRARLGEAARARAAERWSKEAIIARWSAELDALANDKSLG